MNSRLRDGCWIYRRRDGERLGPVDTAELIELYYDGEIDRTDLVYLSKPDRWVEIAQVEELENRLPRAPGSPRGSTRERPTKTAATSDYSRGSYQGGYSRSGEGHDERIDRVSLHEYPPEISRLHFNWGAFLLPEFWGPTHGYWWAILLMLLGWIPYLGWFGHFVGAVYFGVNGHRFGWDSGRYDSVEHYLETQRVWLYAGIAMVIFNMLLGLGLLALILYLAQTGQLPVDSLPRSPSG